MPDKYLYLLVDALCIIFPFAFSFHPRFAFYKQWSNFVLPCVVTATLFLLWDAAFTALGIWSFNPRYVMGIYLLGLPLEEYLFFICIPYACVFTYFALTNLFRMPAASRAVIVGTWIFAVLLVEAGIWFLPRLYTSVTALLLAAVLFFLAGRRSPFLTSFYICYLVTLIPFYLCNGVLTGAVTPEPVVSYDNKYNLGIRTITIPVEDIFYGMAMLLMNIAGFDYLQRRRIAAGAALKAGLVKRTF